MQQPPQNLPPNLEANVARMRGTGRLVNAGCQLIFGTIFTSISLFIFSMLWFVQAPWFAFLFVSIFVVFGVGMLGTGLWGLVVKPMMVGIAFGPPSAMLSLYRLRPGDSVTVRYDQSARRSVDVRRVLVQLILRERATYRRGTNTYTAIHDNVIDQRESPGRQVARGTALTEEHAFEVPIDSMHSLHAARNPLTWLVKVQIDVPGTPDIVEELEFVVGSQLAGETS